MNETFDYEARIDRARTAMDARGMDALLLTTGTNIDYFTGVTGMFGGNNSSRPLVYLLPRDGVPAIIAQEFLREAVEDSTIPDVRIYERLSHLPNREVRAVIEDRGLGDGRIGVELGEAMTVDVPLAEFLELRRELSRVDFVDASDLIWGLRAVKSEAEVELIRDACEVTIEAYDRTFDDVAAGDSEADVQSTMARHVLKLGGSDPWTVVTSGEGNYARLTKRTGDRTIESGDMVWLDSGCTVGGYWSDFSRAGVVGGPSERQLEAHRRIHEITRSAVSMMEPGRRADEIARRCNESIDELAFPIVANTSHMAGRIGHGLGKQVTEPPSVSEESSTVLEAGMVLTVEPAVATDYGTFHVEENVVVTETGSELLTPDRWQLWTI
jgi:Xaa-Pro aminopeptidase